MPETKELRAQGRGKKRAPRARRSVSEKPAGRYHHGDLRRALIDAALALIERDGAQALTLRAAARLAGVSQAAPYRHFPDKDALLAAVAEDGLLALAVCMRDASAPHARDPGRTLQALGIAYVRFATAHTAHFRVMFNAVAKNVDTYPALAEASDAVFALLLDAITRGQREGAMRLGNPKELALAAWSLVHGFAELEVGGQVPRLWQDAGSADALAERITGWLGAGITAPSEPAQAKSGRARTPRK